MSTLAKFLNARGIRQADFARRIGRTQSFVSRLCNGRQSVSLETALRIERETNGSVPVSSWASTPSNDTQEYHVPACSETIV